MREEFRLIQTAKVLDQVLYSRTSVLQNVPGTVYEVSVRVVFHRWCARTLHVYFIIGINVDIIIRNIVISDQQASANISTPWIMIMDGINGSGWAVSSSSSPAVLAGCPQQVQCGWLHPQQADRGNKANGLPNQQHVFNGTKNLILLHQNIVTGEGIVG